LGVLFYIICYSIIEPIQIEYEEVEIRKKVTITLILFIKYKLNT